jgi:hypothetical protein
MHALLAHNITLGRKLLLATVALAVAEFVWRQVEAVMSPRIRPEHRHTSGTQKEKITRLS